MNQFPIIAVVGSTASGKSALGIRLALEFAGEVINCDSVQVYRDIEIATAKVSLAERQTVPHHLLDFVSPDVTYTAGTWARDAASVISDITARARLPIIVGGTGFYLRALRAPLCEAAATDLDLRERLTRLRARHGAEHLHRILKRVDPTGAARLHPRDWSRTTRAIEVWFQSKRTLSDAWTRDSEHESAPLISAPLHVIALRPERDRLYARINARTLDHFKQGLVEEVRSLLARGFSPHSNALGAHGYRRVVEYLNGTRTLDSAVEQTRLDVRHYAKRQMTWFRREPDVEWFDGFGDDATTQRFVINRVAEILRAA
ncbi:MAG: tRNA (adenosine(37)-N6)-dimethylallyltransferase MiaA [Pyrinomonadaceae bacterium MAG19_C2-C3]|nr:tRNA (adenosine(37)-N6)-dimethylallyltransferase MiaA [Pyrinomonadaceae bacterium MAG19_C2-C3]